MSSSGIQHPKIASPIRKDSYCCTCTGTGCSTDTFMIKTNSLAGFPINNNKEINKKLVELSSYSSAKDDASQTVKMLLPSAIKHGQNYNPLRYSNHNHHRPDRMMKLGTDKREEKETTITPKHLYGGNHLSYLAMFIPLSFIVLIILANFSAYVEAVDCFKCSSRNGSNPACEDPFHNINSTRVITPILPEVQPQVIYHSPCYAGKKGREGLFPASACIKLVGTFDNTGETLVVRHCALDSGTLTQDTELARMSHCGKFQFEGDLLQGCVLACPEDACNSALKDNAPIKFSMLLLMSAFAVATMISAPTLPQPSANAMKLRRPVVNL